MAHEPLEFFYRQGGHYDDDAERYRTMCDPQNIKRMAAAGVRFGRLFFIRVSACRAMDLFWH